MPSGLLDLEITYTATAFTGLAATRARAAEVSVVVVQNWNGGESKDRETLDFSEEDNNLIKVWLHTGAYAPYYKKCEYMLHTYPPNILMWIFRI